MPTGLGQNTVLYPQVHLGTWAGVSSSLLDSSSLLLSETSLVPAMGPFCAWVAGAPAFPTAGTDRWPLAELVLFCTVLTGGFP